MSKFIIYKPCNKILIYEYPNLFEITNHLFNINTLLYHLNALDKSRRKQTSWCQECDKVFDNIIDADIHKENVNHKVKIIEFWTISR